MTNHSLHKSGNQTIALAHETVLKIQELIRHYPDGRQKSALLPVLHIAQEEHGGYLSVELMDYVAALLKIQPIEVYEVATFYSMFNLDPVGKFVIDVCRTGPCAICGGEHILDYLKKKLNINVGETTPDGLFTINEVECLGACSAAPVIQVNTEFYEFLTPEKIDKILDDFRKMANENIFSNSKWVEKFF
jgi:NADH-quinone oxidoreductase subunit E